MKKLCILVSLFLLLLSSVASAANWQWITSTDEYGFFFDADSVTYQKGYNSRPWSGSADVWIKTVYAPQGAAETAEKLGDEKLSEAHHSVIKQRIDFSYKTNTYLSQETFYDNNGKVITSYAIVPDTGDIIPGTIGEIIMERIKDFCRKGFRA